MAAWITGGAINCASHSRNHLWFPVCASVNQLPCRSSRLRLVMRNDSISSSGDAAEDATESVSDPVGVEVSEGNRESLISAANVEKALRGIAITDGDHYGRLGVERGCSSDEVRVAYKNKLLQVLDNNLNENKEVLLLKESYRILVTAEERRLYDWSLARNENGSDRYIWPFEVDKTSPLVSTDNPPDLQPPEDVQPTTFLGYFFFTWFFLSILLLILFYI